MQHNLVETDDVSEARLRGRFENTMELHAINYKVVMKKATSVIKIL